MAHQIYIYSDGLFIYRERDPSWYMIIKIFYFNPKTFSPSPLKNIHKSSRVGVQLRAAAVKTRCAYSTHYLLYTTHSPHV